MQHERGEDPGGAHLSELLAQHSAEPWPASLERGDVIAGVDLVMTDADIVGLALSAIDTRPAPDVRVRLGRIAAELESVLALIPTDAQPYFARLIRLGRAAADR